MTASDTCIAVAVIGAGSMGAGIAPLAARSGRPVRLYDMQPGAAARRPARIAAYHSGEPFLQATHD